MQLIVHPDVWSRSMERLEILSHLYYFWMVAREGTVARAAVLLRLAQPTVSGQIRALEGALGERLSSAWGAACISTEMGRLVSGYADEIFALRLAAALRSFVSCYLRERAPRQALRRRLPSR